MEINDQSLAFLRDLLEKILSRDNAVRKNAEAVLQSTKTQAGFPLLILSLITKLHVAPTPLDAAIRQSASIFFKNIVKEHWNPEEGYVIPAQEKETIKTHLVELMTNAAPDVQRQLGEAVSIVATHDFPEHWSSLLSQLVAKLATNDLTIIKGVMLTANSIFKRYRYVAETESLLIEIKYCLDQFAMPLLQLFQQLSQRVLQSEQNNPELPLLFESLRLMSRIFYSLNWQDIPEVFEDNGSAWMTAFATYLTYKNPLLTSSNNKDEPGPIENLQTAILENINLYANKYEDVFEPYLPQFTQLVWKLLLEVDTNVKYDQLATNGIKFLTTVASKQMNVTLFNDQVLQDIIQQIVVKNITATENDEELFDMNPSDYIRKDMEGSDQDTRRRAAVDLIRTLMKFFANKVSELCLNYINVLLQQYHTTKNWKAKDAALHIVLAVSVQSTNPMTGLSELNSSINIVGIFEQHVLPEIHDNNINNSTTSNAIVKADAIKLICILRNHFPKSFLVNILPHIIRYLQAESVVVQTYAAMCIEKFLTIKDKDPKTNQSTVRLDQSDLLQHFQPLFGGLFNVLENPELSENEYVMKCIMRSLVVAGKEITPVTDLIVSHLLKALEKVYKNPINPYFNHYLFESLALIIKLSCGNEGNATLTEAQASACNKFETILFPIFQVILTQDIAEFIPYVFQIFAQLLAARPKRSGLSDAYRALFPPLLAPVLWERKGNVPALVDLFKAFISRGMNEIIGGNYLTGVLGVFQKLLSAKSTENSAFQLLNTIYAFCPLATITPFIPTIFNLLLLRMQESVKVQKVQPFVRSFVHSISVFSTVYGPNVLYDALESQTQGLVAMIILNVWSHNIQNCAAATKSEKKDILVGGTKLLLESKLVANADAWKGLLIALLPLTEDAVEHDFLFDALEQEEIKAFDSTYSKLAHSSIYSLDVTSDVPLGISYFANALNQFSQASGNEFIGRVQQLNPEQQRAVQVVLQKR